MWMIAAAAAGPWSVTPEIGTDVPVRIGAGVRVEGPGRLRAGVSGGFVPKAYVALSNTVVTGLFEGYTDAEAELVESALASSVVGRVDLGWRPHARAGWWFAGGASAIGLGGDATAAEVVEGLTGTSLPRQAGTPVVLDATATLLTVDVVTGWDLRVWRPPGSRGALVVRPSLGWSFTVASASRISAPDTPDQPRLAAAVDALEAEAGDLLDDLLTAYVHPPVIGLNVGWTFGPRAAPNSGSRLRSGH